MKKTKEVCDKCKTNTEDLWLSSKINKDGSNLEIWICEDCLIKKHPELINTINHAKSIDKNNKT